MAETRLTDVITPEVFSAYTLEPSIYRSRFWRAGLIEVNPAITALLNGGGTTFEFPFWQDTVGTSGDIPSETVDITINNVTSGRQEARRQLREKGWGQNAIAQLFAGDSPLESAATRVNDYWAQAYDIASIATLEGVLANNIAADTGDLINDISGAGGAAAQFSDEGVIDAQAKLGENGVVGRPDQSDFIAIVVHPMTYAFMRKQDLIDTEAVSEQGRIVERYLRMEVIVDRNIPVNTTPTPDVYDTYMFKAGALQWGVGTTGYVPTEMNREPKRGFGIDELITRRVFALHVVGTRWLDASVAGISPTDAELRTSSNYDRVYQQENMRFVVLRHTLA